MDTVNDVAVYLVNKGTGMNFPSKNGNLKLQKLLYYANAVNLSINGVPLFSETLQAWPEGPVVKSIYIRYRYYSLYDEAVYSLSEDVEKILEFVVSLFDDFSAEELVEMTHEETPWEQFEDKVGEYKDIEIPNEDIKNFYEDTFKNMYNEQKVERKMSIGSNEFIFNPLETQLTSEDKEILKNDFKNIFNQIFYVYKEDGELVAY